MDTYTPPGDVLAGLYDPRPIDRDAWAARMEAKQAEQQRRRELAASVIAASKRKPPKLPAAPKAVRAPKPVRPRPDPIRVCDGGCGRVTRPSHFPASAHPGTVARVNAGLCSACDARRPKRAPVPPKPCAGCGRMTRSARQLRVDFPDTVVRVTADRCSRCADTARPVRRLVVSARPAGPRPPVPTSTLVELYVEQNLGSTEVARRVGMTPTGVLKRLRAVGVTVRPVGLHITHIEES